MEMEMDDLGILPAFFETRLREERRCADSLVCVDIVEGFVS